MLNRIQRIWKRKDLLLLLLLWLIVQAYLLITFGIKTNGEALRVISEANKLISQGRFSTPSFFLYLTEISLVYLKLKLGFGYGLIVFIHLLVNLIALLCLHKYMTVLYASKKLALIGCALFILCYPYQLYNSFIYTESLFFSLSVIYTCYLLNDDPFTFKKVAVLCLLLLLLCITRPTGIFFLGASIIYISIKLSNHISVFKRISIFSILSIAGLYILNLLMGSGKGFDIMLPFRDERIICEVPTLPYEVNIKITSNSNSLYGLFYYITHNFEQFSRLAWLKTKAFFGLTRTYYSVGHNVFLICLFYPLYIFIMLAIARFKRMTPASFIYFISLAIIFWLSVVFSCDEWHNRFFLTLTPFLIIPALYLFTKKNANQ